jgi:hypothetical protein
MRHNDNWVEERRNQAARLVRASNRARDTIRFSSNETLQHLLLKTHICHQLARADKSFITEAIFEKGGRADILVLDDHVVIECLESETEPQVALKTSTYPTGFSIEFARFVNGEVHRGMVRP